MSHDRYSLMTAEEREYWRMRDRIGSGGRCCDQATRVFCVCRGSVTCPVHGLICVGSHD